MSSPAVSSDYANAEALLLRSILAGETEVANRKHLGAMVPIQLFQALRLIGFGSSVEAMVGDGAHALVYQAGQRVGQILGNAILPVSGKDLPKYVEQVRKLCLALKIGEASLEGADNEKGKLTFRVDECVSCAGITGSRAPICNFEAGLVGGITRVFVAKPVRAVETRCNAVGDRTCGIDVEVKE